MLDRRTFVESLGPVLTGVVGFSGCQSLTGDGIPTVQSEEIDTVSAACVTEQEFERDVSVTLNNSGKGAEFEGALAAESTCPELSLTVNDGVGRDEYEDDSVHLTVDPAVDQQQGTDCEQCSARIAYSGSASFDTAPSTVYVYHAERIDSEWKRVGPLASESV